MTYYPPTLLPSSLPCKDYDAIVERLCDRCLRHQYDEKLSELVKQQYFDLTMELMEFWYKEIEEGKSK